MVEIIRYSSSPIGPYDELLLIPGYFKYESNQTDKQGTRIEKQNLKVSRIYVSDKKTCWNGRKNWNIPKHLARFEFRDLPGKGVEIKVFPNDIEGSETDAAPSSRPFFEARYTPISYLPSFPVSTLWLKYVGMDLRVVQPPLPEGNGSQGELPGTDTWCLALPVQYSKKASLGWFDLKQDAGTKEEVTERDALSQEDGSGRVKVKENAISEHWWPGFGRWKLGVKMEDATIELGEGEHWK